MPELYYIKDKNCTLVYRKSLSVYPFILASPNGNGVFEVDLKWIHENAYVDGRGDLQTPYNSARIILRFFYSSHVMDLKRLLEADEIIIPYSFSLSQDISERFVLTNDSVVTEWFSGFVAGGDLSNKNIPYGELQLEFESVEPKSRDELLALIYYNEPSAVDDGEDPPVIEGNRISYFSSMDSLFVDSGTNLPDVNGLVFDFNTI